jgi:proline iminopeptidase
MNLADGEHQLKLNGVRHWVRVVGANLKTVPLMIVHGGPGGNNYAFERTIGLRLEAFSTVVYVEQRGSGRSGDAPDGVYTVPALIADLEALRVALGVERMNLLGYSFGAELALEYAAAHPEGTHRVVAQAASIFGSRLETVQLQGFQTVATGDLRAQIIAIADLELSSAEKIQRVWDIVNSDTVDRLLFHNAANARVCRKLWDEFDERFANNRTMANDFQFWGRDPHRAFALLLRITAPVLVCIGLFDRNCGVDLNVDTTRLLPNSSLVVFQHSAHFPDIEEPELYVREVRAFLGL